MTRVGWQSNTSLFLAAAIFTAAGANHFWHSSMYVQITPPSFPHRLELVWVSGFFEIIGGLGLLVPLLRRAAGWGLCLLLVCVFPANIYMAVHAEQFADVHASAWAWWRLPLQPLLIIWIWLISRPPRQNLKSI